MTGGGLRRFISSLTAVFAFIKSIQSFAGLTQAV
jgi:hypothetical protein